MNKEMIKPTIVLIIICAVVSAMLALAYNLAGIADIGTGIDQKDLDIYVKTTIPNATKLEIMKTDIDDPDVIAVYKDEGGAGVALFVKTKGYHDEIKMLVGLNMDGEFVGAHVVDSKETPNLGTQIAEPDFINKFLGKSKQVKVDKDGGEIEAIAGATISSRAFTTGVDKAFKTFELIKGDL